MSFETETSTCRVHESRMLAGQQLFPGLLLARVIGNDRLGCDEDDQHQQKVPARRTRRSTNQPSPPRGA